ncbi:MAG: serine/tyrosine/threonine adenylyltransferase [Hyphomicrobiales bacterium]
MTFHFPFQNTFARLPDRFFARVAPTPVAAPRLIRLNLDLAADLGLDAEWLAGPEALQVLAGGRIPEAAEPIALAYAGHQFGHFVPQLGDGRAVLLGEIVDRRGVRRDIQLKGSGRTPFSRGGDGRAALGPVLREYVVSEAMARLGIPTTRALAAVVTGEMVARETLLPGAVLTRVASSHIRIGTFQYFAARGDTEGLRLLADHAIARHYPDVAAAEHPYRALLEGVVQRQADLIAAWMLVGFIHGVMNTDNMSIAGETIDYGPCAFMDHYDPAMVFSSIDHHGRYAYANQPKIAVWNLARFAETLLPLLADDETKAIAQAEEVLGGFAQRFQASYLAGMRRKLGLFNPEDGDVQLAQDFLDLLSKAQADFTLAFRRLGEAADDPEAESLRAVIGRTDLYEAWVARWRERLSREPQDSPARRSSMLAANPAFIPRNHRIEAMIDAAVHRNDFAPFEELLAVLAKPFEDQPGYAAYMEPPEEHERVMQTFCGT